MAHAIVLAIVVVSGSAFGQGVVMPLEYRSPLIVPLPTPDKWSGISIGIESYAWLDNKKVRPTDVTDVNRTTLMLSFSRTYTYDRRYEPFSYQLRRSVERHAFNRLMNDRKVSEYWARSLATSISREERDKALGLIKITVPIKFPKLVQSVIGEGGASLQVNGSYRVSFDGTSQWDNRAQVSAYKQSKFPSLDMEQVSSFTIIGTIGSKIHVTVDQDSRRQSDLENRIQIRYKGTEDDVIKTIEAGNTNLSLPNTKFAGYSSRVQGLFGIKVAAQLGNLGLTVITSQEKGSTERTSFTAGSDVAPMTRRDWDYERNKFFDLGKLGTPEQVETGDADFAPGVDEILDIKLFVEETDITKYIVTPGTAYADPFRPNLHEDENRKTSWMELDKDKYFVPPGQFYVEMDQYISPTENLACWMRVLRDGQEFEVGNISDTTYALMLIKADGALATYRTFNYEWKNVYYLGQRELDPDGLDIIIYKGKAGDEDKPNDNLSNENGVPYIQILGLDSLDLNGDPRPDGKFDGSDNLVDFARGHLFFPNRMPFADVTLEEPIPEIYTLTNDSDIREASKYFIAITTKQTRQRNTEFSLGHINIIEGSEVVTLNGRPLEKNRDYKIYYELGRIQFLSEEALDPTADVSIDYEYQPFFVAEKKSLFGTRLEYVLSSNTKFGSTLLLKNEKSTDRKPRVGQEESKYILWDTDFSTRFELPLLTNLVDALPLIEANSPSNISLSGEIAQSLPNPNTKGEAFIDDFEGAREAYNLSTIRRNWTKSSAPDGPDSVSYNPDSLEYIIDSLEIYGEPLFYNDYLINPRAKLIWYNPWQETPVTDIWDREVRDRDNRTHTLMLVIEPEETALDRSWGGIMRPISRGSQDQTRTQFLEIRMQRPRSSSGQMRIYLGEISEDIDGDGKLDTEDLNRNEILDEGEDIGLDGWTDEEERENLGSEDPDPSGDNWYYDNDEDVRDNYEQINGTESNGIEVGGYLPDTEDISGNKNLNVLNSYFEFTLDFGDDVDKYLVPNSDWKGWESFRFPLASPDDATGNPTWEKVAYARIILTGFMERDSVQIASMDLVSTRWLGDDVVSLSDTTGGEETAPSGTEETELEVAVINTEENSEVYVPPPGVTGYHDKTTDVTEKEQSLYLKFTNFKPGDFALAQRNLYKGENYAGYRRLQMFVHSSIADSSTTFLFRMGSDSTNYYEFHTSLHSSSLWDEDNWVDMNLDAITQVKGKLDDWNNALEPGEPRRDTLSVGNYGIRGNPKMTNIIYLAVGVMRPDVEGVEEYVSGELWLDELRVNDVRRDKGLARRVSTSVSLSDLGSFRLDYSKEDEFFRRLTASDRNNLGSGAEKTGLRMSTDFRVDKLLPPSWGANIKIGYNWGRTETAPRLKPGSDIVIPDDQREAETTRRYTSGFTFGESFNKKSAGWLWDLTLNKFRSNFSLSSSRSKSPTVPINESETYSAHADYGLTPGNKYIKVFAWTSIIPFFPKAISDAEMGYTPSKLTFSGDLSRNQTHSVSRSTGAQEFFSSSTYRRDLKARVTAAYNIFSSIPLTFNFSTDRDLRDPEKVKLSFNPKKFMLGTELSRRQSFTAKYNPKIISFLSTGASFQSSYTENSDPKRGNSSTSREARNDATMSLKGTFHLKRFFGMESRGRGSEKKGGFLLFRPFLWVIRPIVGRVGDIQLSYTQKNNYANVGFVDRPSLKFQLGFTKDPGVDIDQSGRGARRVSNSKTENYSGSSTIDFILGTKIATSYKHGISSSATRDQISKSTTFPTLSVSIGSLQKYRILGWLFKSLSINSSYSRKVNQSITKGTGDKVKETINTAFAPLVGVSITWPKPIKTQGKFDLTVADNNTFSGSSKGQRTTAKGFTLTNSYSFKSPSGFKIPILGRLKFQSTLSMSIDVSRRVNKSERIELDGSRTLTSESVDLSISPRASYSFSTNIKGGMNMRWTDREDKRTNSKSHVRQVGIWVEIKF
jgi:hypothetical protein